MPSSYTSLAETTEKRAAPWCGLSVFETLRSSFHVEFYFDDFVWEGSCFLLREGLTT